MSIRNWPTWQKVLAVAVAILVSAGAVALALVRSVNGQMQAQTACDNIYSQYPAVYGSPPKVDPSRPVIGWNPYNFYSTKATQVDILNTTTAMAKNGMRAAGYKFVNLDDGWQSAQRDSAGNLVPNPKLFGCGIGRLANFVHASGFDFGIYASANSTSCTGLAGSGDHVQQDVHQFAQWGVDLIKLDWCGASYDAGAAQRIAQSWQQAIRSTGRRMILMVNAGGAPVVLQNLAPFVNSFRVDGDICPEWTYSNAKNLAWCGPQYHLGIRQYLSWPPWGLIRSLVSPGHFPDPDMLEIGNGPTWEEEQTQMSMWAMWSAPLIAGNDIVHMDSDTLRVLTNPHILAVDQDRLGRVARLLYTRNGVQYWRKRVEGGVVLAAVNLTDSPRTIRLTLAQAAVGATKVQDLWTGQSFAPASYFQSVLRAHAVRMLEFNGS